MAVGRPKAEVMLSAGFSAARAPELIGIAVTFSGIHRRPRVRADSWLPPDVPDYRRRESASGLLV
jgi:hypothetical protein